MEAQLFELDQFGCVMKTDKIFRPGDTLSLDLVVEMPFENISAEGVNGLVTECRKYCSNFYYSIDFMDDVPRPHSPLAGKLKRIRDVVNKKQSLRSRRSPGGQDPSFRELA